MQVTHIIYSINDELNFHIIDPLMISTDEGRQKLKKKIDKNNRNGRNGQKRSRKRKRKRKKK